MKAACFCILIFTLSGCVSIDLGPKRAKHASDVKYNAPDAPFEKASGNNVDEIWRNPNNGNAISYLSDCSDNSDPSLRSIEQGVLSGLYPYTYQSQKNLMFDERGARRVQVLGTVDGVPTLVDLLIFKRNNCIYILSYVGLEQKHAENLGAFQKFLEGFKAP